MPIKCISHCQIIRENYQYETGKLVASREYTCHTGLIHRVRQWLSQITHGSTTDLFSDMPILYPVSNLNCYICIAIMDAGVLATVVTGGVGNFGLCISRF